MSFTPHARLSDTDHRHLQTALAQAEQARIACPPNPAVGCVVVGTDGAVQAEGHTQITGGPHAEAMALRELAARGGSARGATVYVTLEPCSHFGRTPPCADALVAAGVARVVVALRDPNPLVGGRGLDRLRAAGIVVDEVPPEHPLAQAARDINLGFLSRIQRRRPWVRLKVAGSLDGFTALPDGRSQWITGAAARADGHRFRAQASAVLTGIGTVLADDPQLNVRGLDTPRQPLRVVVDSALRLPDGARLLASPQGLRIYTAQPDAARRDVLQARGAIVIARPQTDAGLPRTDASPRVDLAAMLEDLAVEAQVNELHVEAGARLNGALIAADLVDEYLIYQAPMLLGEGRGLWRLPAPAGLEDAPRLRWVDCRMVGDDLRLLARPPGREQF